MSKIISIPVLDDNYIWLIIVDRHCVIVDPAQAKPVISLVNELDLLPSAILITHHHHDHIGGVKALLEQYPELKIFANKSSTFAKSHPQNFVTASDAKELTLTNSSLKINAISVPGHTIDHMAYQYNEHCFCGDTLFSAGCGRLFEGSAEQMYDSLLKLKALRADTLFYPAHEYTHSNLIFAHHVEPDNQVIKKQLAKANKCQQQGVPTLPCSLTQELKINPFLRCELPELKFSVEAHSYTECNSASAVFKQLRLWKDRF